MSQVTSSDALKTSHWPLVYVAVALTSMATLILELSLTRIFAVVFESQYAFLAISIALLGLGVGGVLSYYFPQRGAALFRRLGFLAGLNSGVVIVALVVVLRGGALGLAAVCCCAAAPFLLSGLIVALAIGETIARVDRVYFYFLLGAGGGYLLLIPLLTLVGGPSAALGSAALLAASSAVWFGLVGSVRGRAMGVAAALALVLFLIYNPRERLLDVTQAKGHELGHEVFVRWNIFSRISVTEDKDHNRTIFMDGEAASPIARLSFDPEPAWAERELKRTAAALVYRLRPRAKTLILGAGGGWDVARAIASGSRDVTAVEGNPIIATTIMRKQHSEWSNGLYLRPEVHVEAEEGLSFLRRSTERYQVIDGPLAGKWASTSDAFRDYLNHLSRDGVISFNPSAFDPQPRSLSLVPLAIDSLKRLGQPDPARHVIIISETRLSEGVHETVLVSRTPFSAVELDRAREWTLECGFARIYLPDEPGDTAFHELLHPDNKAHPWAVGYLVPPALTVSLLVMLVIWLAPPLLLRARLPRERGVPTFLLYFLCLGAGYVLIQVGLSQKLELFLGRPTYAPAVVVFSMLLASGLGSYRSRRWTHDADGRLQAVLISITGVVVLAGFLVDPLTEACAALPLAFRFLVAMALIAPAGFLMGMPLPAGLSRLARWHPPSVRWAWALNAIAGVLGSAAAMFLATVIDLRATLLCGGALYLGALLLVAATRRAASQIR